MDKDVTKCVWPGIKSNGKGKGKNLEKRSSIYVQYYTQTRQFKTQWVPTKMLFAIKTNEYIWRQEIRRIKQHALGNLR